MAHGSRRAEANADLEELACRVRDQGGYKIVEVSYLELAEPTIPQGGRQCVAHGATRVLMLPYFLSAGRHVTDDLQVFRQDLAAEFPEVQFDLCPPLGLHPLMTQIVLDRLLESSEAAEPRLPAHFRHLIEILESMRKRKAMYLGEVTIEAAVHYLHGFGAGCSAAGLVRDPKTLEVARERGWDAGALHYSEAMIRHGLSVDEAIDELIAIEIEAIKRSAVGLD